MHDVGKNNIGAFSEVNKTIYHDYLNIYYDYVDYL